MSRADGISNGSAANRCKAPHWSLKLSSTCSADVPNGPLNVNPSAIRNHMGTARSGGFDARSNGEKNAVRRPGMLWTGGLD